MIHRQNINKIMFSSAAYLKSVETMPRLFPWDPSDGRETFVVWDMEGYSISESFDPFSIMEQIKLAIRRDGFEGEVTVLLDGPENTWSKELKDKLFEAGFEVYPFEGVKSARFNQVISDVVSWSFMEEPSNLLILSQDKKEMEQFPNFSFLRQALEEEGFFVVSAEPDTLVNQETAFRGIELYNVYVQARRNENAV